MRLWVEIPDGRSPVPRLRGAGRVIVSERTRTIDATVFRIARIVTVKRQLIAAVEVDAFIPEMWRTHIPQLDARWVGPGIFRTKAYVLENKKSDALARFLESGLSVMDLRGDE